MARFRILIFWSHLAAGLIAGLFIGIMCFSGTVLAFEDQIVAWAERDARQVVPSANTTHLPLGELQHKLREAQPEFRPASVTLQNDPAAAVAFSAGRDGGFYVNPYTGEVRQPASTKVHDFMQTMLAWHRFLGREGDQRPVGKAINGTGNIVFFVLAVSGLYLWWRRSWTWRSVKAIVLFNWKLTGKARDFNWHNTIGVWCAAVLVILTLTAIPISYRWGSNLVYRIVGEEPTAQPSPAGSPAPTFEITRPSPEGRPLGYDAVLSRVTQDFPRWEQITFRASGAQRGRAPAAAASSTDSSENRKPKTENPSQPLTVTIRESGSWPRTAVTTLILNPFTGEVLKHESFGDLTPGRRLRTWTRFLHTGQALGWPGQLAAGVACFGGCFLVYTGFALSWRRFFRRTKTPTGAE